MKFVKSTLQTRKELLNLIDKNKNVEVAEVGVYKGYFAKQLFEVLKYPDYVSSYLYLIDPWNSPKCEGQMVGSEQDGLELVEYFKENHNVILKKLYSQHAATHFRDNALDLVYLDAEHTYDGVYSDIELWLPKVKPGGVLAGHDIFAPEHIGVTQAVMDYFSCCVYVIPAETCPYTSLTVNPSWYIIKS